VGGSCGGDQLAGTAANRVRGIVIVVSGRQLGYDTDRRRSALGRGE
jgi:hypothetical protein